MIDGLLTLEKDALERLTNERRVSGSIPAEVEDTLSMLGVHWDEIEEEYFSIDKFQKETFDRLAAEYVSQDYA
jgi:hypothetical protein